MKGALRKLMERLDPRSRRLGLFVLVGVVAFALPVLAHAGVIEWILMGLAYIFMWLTSLVGFILFHLVRGLIAVAAYSDFVAPGPTAVRVGWVVTRDLANMFFILILLIIAFATILGREEYNIRNTLPRLLITAIVINFSKTIAGLFIDLGQVIMLTFVNGFKDAAGGNFLNAFQVNNLLRLKDQGVISESGLLLGMMLAFIMVSIATAVVLIMLVSLLFRVVMLWILIILAPIAFLAGTIPPGQQYYRMWWDEMKRYIIFGPAVAFFLWLALLSAQLSNGNLAAGDAQGGKFDLATGASALETTQQQTSTGIPSAASSTDVYLSMIIFTALLFGGLKIATQLGGVTGGVASYMSGMMKRRAMQFGKWAGKRTAGGLLRGTGAVTRGAAGAVEGTLGRIPLVGGVFRAGARVARTAGTVASVQGQRLAPPGTVGAMRQAVMGSPEELAKISPTAFAQAAKGAKGDRAKDFADQAGKDKAAMKALTKSGAGVSLYKQLKKDGEKDPDAAKKADQLGKSVWNQLDAKEQEKIVGGMSAEEARANVGAADMAKALPHLSKEAVNEIGEEGTQDQIKALVEALVAVLERPDGANKFKELLRDKKMSAADLAVLGGKNDKLGNAVLDVALEDPQAMKKIASDPASRDALKPYAGERVRNAVSGADRGRKGMQALALGSEFTPADMDRLQLDAAQLPVKQLMDFARNAPDDDAKIQENLAKALTGAAQRAPEMTAKKLTDGPVGELIDPQVAASVGKTFESSVDRMAGKVSKVISELEKASPGSGASLKTELDDFKSAVRDLNATQQAMTRIQQDYAKAEKAKDKNAMASLALQFAQEAQKLTSNRSRVEQRFDSLKSKT